MKEAKDLSGVSFLRALSPFTRAPSHDLMLHLLTPSYWGLGFNKIWGRDTNIQIIADSDTSGS